MNVIAPYRDESAAGGAAHKPTTMSANYGAIAPGAEGPDLGDIAVEDDFGFGVRSAKEVS